MVNTGTVAARGGLRDGEKYGMCGVRDYGYIDHRLARLADLMMDVASLRVSAVRPDIITTKRREGKYTRKPMSGVSRCNGIPPDLYEFVEHEGTKRIFV